MKDDSRHAKAVPVLVPMPAERPYTYAVPDGITVVPGSIVRVPLGPREVAGIVWDSVPESEREETLNKARGLLRAIEMAETQL